MNRTIAHPERIEALSQDLNSLERKGIVYLGPQADIYQPLERKYRLARKALETFLNADMPVFIVTRSESIIDDIDLLRDLASKGLVEVSVTIASPNAIKALEPQTASVAKRINLIKELTSSGISTSVHISPIIPFFDEIEELEKLLEMIATTGTHCAYACMLRVTSNYYQLLLSRLYEIHPEKVDRFLRAFPKKPPHGSVMSAPNHIVFAVMSHLSRYATTRSIPFACVHIPPFDTIERSGGVFRYKLPNVGDMVRYLDRYGLNDVSLSELIGFLRDFPAVDDAYLDKIRSYWYSRELFRNTYFHSYIHDDSTIHYQRSNQLDLFIENMRVTGS
jgi:hypothetical protein